MKRKPGSLLFHRKNADEEAFVAHLNDILSQFQEQDLLKDIDKELPNLFVVGVPRSGTTLLTQLIAANLDVGYVNNLIAAFWKAPVYGIRLSRKLLGSEVHTSYRSDFGRTSGIWEPHEFGYFWSDLLGYEQPGPPQESNEDRVDWQRLKLILMNMNMAFERPMVFKGFHISWHLGRMQQEMPKACFVRVRRDPIDTALSLLSMRERILGNRESWVSMKPAQYEDLKHEPYWRQVAGQVYYIERMLDTQLATVSAGHCVEMSLTDLCADPAAQLELIRELLYRQGYDVALKGAPPNRFQCAPLSGSDIDRRRVSEAWKQLNE